MFKTQLSETALTTRDADAVFSRIKGEKIFGDSTFLSSLRGLLDPRMKEDDEVTLVYHNNSYNKKTIEKHDIKEIMSSLVNNSFLNGSETGYLRIVDCVGALEDTEAIVEKLQREFEATYSGWVLIPRITEFFRKAFKAIAFVNPDAKCALVVTDRLTVQTMHYLQVCIPVVLPWFFVTDEERDLNDDEVALITGMRSKDKSVYEAACVKIASKYDFRASKIKRLLNGYEKMMDRETIRRCESKIGDYIEEINRLTNKIGEYLEKKAQQEQTLFGLEEKIASGQGNEVMDFFLANKNLVLKDVSGRDIYFKTKGYLMYWDEDYAERVIKNRSSYVYEPSGYTCPYDKDLVEVVMRKIFIDQEFRIKMCSSYRVTMNGACQGIQGDSYGYEFDEYTPNTHIDRFACLGNHQREILECLKRNDIIGAVAQCQASAASLNFGDSTVMNQFMLRMFKKIDKSINTRCIELPNGEVVDFEGAIKYVKEEKQAEKSEE